MNSRSSIEWTETTWNPTTGCDRISAGRDNCYALTLAKRLKAMGSAKYQSDGDPRTSGPGFGVATHAHTLRDPPLDLGWVRELRDQCAQAKVAFFFKQVGGRTPKAGGRQLDGRTWDQMPQNSDDDRAATRSRWWDHPIIREGDLTS